MECTPKLYGFVSSTLSRAEQGPVNPKRSKRQTIGLAVGTSAHTSAHVASVNLWTHNRHPLVVFWRQVALDSLDCATSGPAGWMQQTAYLAYHAPSWLLTLPLHSRCLQFGLQHDQDAQDDQDVSVGNVAVLATILGPPAPRLRYPRVRRMPQP